MQDTKLFADLSYHTKINRSGHENRCLHDPRVVSAYH